MTLFRAHIKDCNVFMWAVIFTHIYSLKAQFLSDTVIFCDQYTFIHNLYSFMVYLLVSGTEILEYSVSITEL
jgi:hypothetical protein